MYEVAMIQLSRKTYFWVIKDDSIVIASSALIAEKYEVDIQAEAMSHQLGLGGYVTIEERE